MQFRFGQCSLDPARRELRLGGAAVTVEPQGRTRIFVIRLFAA